uniref:hypothetical protein n=1 Tax=Algoriphagus chordae TaxID=237019 RepID=UPI0037434AA2
MRCLVIRKSVRNTISTEKTGSMRINLNKQGEAQVDSIKIKETQVQALVAEALVVLTIRTSLSPCLVAEADFDKEEEVPNSKVRTSTPSWS